MRKTAREVLVLVRQGVHTRKALAEALGIPQSSLNGRVATLVREGHLQELSAGAMQLSSGRGPYELSLTETGIPLATPHDGDP